MLIEASNDGTFGGFKNFIVLAASLLVTDYSASPKYDRFNPFSLNKRRVKAKKEETLHPCKIKRFIFYQALSFSR